MFSCSIPSHCKESDDIFCSGVKVLIFDGFVIMELSEFISNSKLLYFYFFPSNDIISVYRANLAEQLLQVVTLYVHKG